MAYRAEFTISRIGEFESSPADRASLLVEVRDYLWEKINVGDSRADIEYDAADDLAFANIDAERHLNDKLWRLSVRLYANEDELRAEVSFGVALEDGVSSRPAPMFMSELVERYDCRVGPHRLRVSALEENELEAFVFDPRRRLPILMVSRDAKGNFPYGGIGSLSKRLLGMAQVVEPLPRGHYRKEGGYKFAPYGGAARIIWPGARPNFIERGKGGFYIPSKMDIASVVDDLENDASPESFDREFIAINIACMRFRNEQLRSRAQADESKELKQSQRRARKAEREIERLERDLAAERTERIRAENLLDTSLRDVERLNEELERATKTDGLMKERENSRRLRDERDTLKHKLAKQNETIRKGNATIRKGNDTIRKLFGEVQRYKQTGHTMQNEGNGFDSLIGNPTQNPGQLSLVGHGLNIMRDPVRRFIIDRLASVYNGHEGVRLALDKISADTKGTKDLESALDFGNFHIAVSSNQEYFGKNAHRLSSGLRKIREYRNRTIHPVFQENTATQRSKALLTDISEVLRMIGASEESQQVEDLMSAL